MTVSADNFVFVGSNKTTNHCKYSANLQNDEELFLNNKTNCERRESDRCNESQALDTCTFQDDSNEHEIETFIYMLTMLIMSNVLSSVLRIFYR